MAKQDLERIARTLRHAVVIGGEKALVLQHSGLERHGKGGRDFATNADIEVQQLIVAALNKDTPETEPAEVDEAGAQVAM